MRFAHAALALAAPLSSAGAALAASQDLYREPPAIVRDLVTAPPSPGVSISPDGGSMLMTHREALPPLADVTRPMLRLAGMRIDPHANARFSTSFGTRVVHRALRGGAETEVPLPDGARVAGTSWSPDGARFVVTVVTANGSELWTATTTDPATPRRVTDRLNTVTGGVSWAPDGARVLCHLVPEDRGEPPAAPRVPAGPNVQETGGRKSPLRTYQDLLTSEYDADTWEYHATTDLALLSLDGGDARTLGRGVYSGASLSPDGRWLMTTRIRRPYTFLMPYYRFPQRIEVAPLEDPEAAVIGWTVPLGEGIPIGGVRTGARSFQWAASHPAALFWAEALDGGDPKTEAPHRDRWMTAAAPFERDESTGAVGREVLRVEHRARGLTFFDDPNLFAAAEYDRDRRWVRSMLHTLDGSTAPRLLEDRSSNDRYGDPGALITHPGPFGRSVARVDGGWIYRTGRGASDEGDRPFLRRQSLASLETEELWRCPADAYESVVDVMDTGEAPTFVTRRETRTTPPNYVLHDGPAAKRVALTDFPDPQPGIRGITKQRLTYERSDGIPLSATLYLPAGHEPGTRLPMLVWGYPREYNDASTAGQISGSTERFTRLARSSHLLLLTQGYAVLDGATMPIIGDAETMNDTFVTQLVASAQAAIDVAVDMGVADPDRVGVAGHSYGAFMTTNLLAHCDLFRAGIARSGAYNRTLTPFGFQSERRTLWQAPETYFAVSPFMHADHIDEPVLLIHGEADNNSGTFPLQSRRLYQAIKGNGGRARLVMLPGESHGYRARESVLHVQAEMIDWMDEHVKAPRKTIRANVTDR
ncbi:MAG: prolyl oligopeptidase family serine peptidase [Planctomycetota bacterium]